MGSNQEGTDWYEKCPSPIDSFHVTPVLISNDAKDLDHIALGNNNAVSTNDR